MMLVIIKVIKMYPICIDKNLLFFTVWFWVIIEVYFTGLKYVCLYKLLKNVCKDSAIVITK